MKKMSVICILNVSFTFAPHSVRLLSFVHFNVFLFIDFILYQYIELYLKCFYWLSHSRIIACALCNVCVFALIVNSIEL